MSLLPFVQLAEQDTSHAEEIQRLRSLLNIERKARAEAEVALAEQQREMIESPVPSRMAMIAGLAKLAESRDDDTGQHLSRIRHYTTCIASAYAEQFPARLPQYQVPIIGATSILHDIGKVGISDQILLHQGKLSTEQFELMKTHTLIGGDILLALSEQLGRDSWIDTAIQITLSHHERFDGLGYPFGLANTSINLPARIVAIADVYDALRSKRAYKPAMEHGEAVAIIEANAGTQFDPEIVTLFTAIQNDFESIARRLNNMESAEFAIQESGD